MCLCVINIANDHLREQFPVRAQDIVQLRRLILRLIGRINPAQCTENKSELHIIKMIYLKNGLLI